MNKLAVIGEKVSSYSISPFVHNIWLKKYNLPYSYFAYDVSQNNLDSFVLEAKSNLFGFNVTTPFKNKIIGYLDFVDEVGMKTQSINVVKNIDGKLIGFNTDMQAFLKQFNYKKKYKNIIILGDGGVTKSILFAIINFFITKKLYVISRKVESKNQSLNCSNMVNYTDYGNLPKLLESCDLLINTTPIAIIDKLIDIKNLNKNAEIFDVNYINSKFYLMANKLNIKISNGYNMFISQAQYSFYNWFNIMPDKKFLTGLNL